MEIMDIMQIKTEELQVVMRNWELWDMEGIEQNPLQRDG